MGIEGINLKGRDLLSLHDFSAVEIAAILDFAGELKQRRKDNKPYRGLEGKTLGMIFQKSSTRTRVSFEVGMHQLGGYPLFLNSSDLQLGRGESIEDTARVLSRYLDGIMIRTYAHEDVVKLAEYAEIPVINGLTDLLHPCQALADLLTIKERLGALAGLRLAYVGDGNNVCHSLMFGCAKAGMEMRVASPAGYTPNEEVLRLAREDARLSGGEVSLTSDPVEAVKGAQVIVTDVWTSMGQEEESLRRAQVFPPYQVNRELAAQADHGFVFLHCLPAHRGEEVTAEIIDGPASAVWDEAENRLHAQKAVLAMLL